MIEFEATAGDSEGYATYDSGGMMHNTGARPDSLSSRRPSRRTAPGRVEYRLTDAGYTVSFIDE